MFSRSTRLKIKEILSRIEKAEPVTFEERVYIRKFADKDQSVANSLLRAKRLQRKYNNLDEIESLLNDLNIGNVEPDNIYSPEEDLGDWFTGAPSWLGRS